jgi:putative ATP-binding cassette transporter
MMSYPTTNLWRRIVTIGAPFFKSEIRGHIFLILGVLILMLLVINGLNILNSYVGRDFMSALAERHLHQFYGLAVLLAAVFAGSTLIEVLMRFTQDRLVLRWREWLTRHLLDRYLAGRAYHRLEERKEVDNPDQRISQDVTTFTTSSLSFLVLLFNAVLILFAFGGVLWSITPWLFLAMVCYAAAGTFGTFFLGKRLMHLDNLQLQKEADFRYALGRLREHAEAVVQLSGEKDERSRLGQLLQRLVANFREVIRVSRNLSFFTTGYNYLPQIIPAAVVAPLYMRGEVEFGTVTQAAMAFSQALGAFSLIVTQFQQLSAYAAVVHRLGALWEATEPEPVATTGPQVETQPARHKVAYERVTLQQPQSDKPLCRELSFEISEGQRILVTGSNDGGKNALLRATAGEWQSGSGRIVKPQETGEILFLPRHAPLMPGPLRELLLFGLVQQDLPDERLLAVLEQVGLGALAHQPGALDRERDWPNVLTDSQRQELAFARLLLANPRFAYVECDPGVLDSCQLEKIYDELARTPITYVSVTDDPRLARFHDWRLELGEDGAWSIRPMQASEKR